MYEWEARNKPLNKLYNTKYAAASEADVGEGAEQLPNTHCIDKAKKKKKKKLRGNFTKNVKGKRSLQLLAGSSYDKIRPQRLS